MTVLENTCTPYGMKGILEELSLSGSLDLTNYDEETREMLSEMLEILEVHFQMDKNTVFVHFSNLQNKLRVDSIIEILGALLTSDVFKFTDVISPKVYNALEHFLIGIKCPHSLSGEQVRIYC